MNRLEIYGVLALMLLAAIGGAYFKGRADENKKITTEQLAANAKALQDAATAATARAAADDTSRRKAEDFITRIEQGIANVDAKFSKLPTVVVDDRGCQRLTDAARLRWNAVELLPAGPTVDPAGKPAAAVPAGAVPSP